MSTPAANEGTIMPHAQVPISRVQQVLTSINDHQRLTAMVMTMAQEIERLDEDNAQLRAAIAMYREVVRRYAVKRS